MAPPNFTMIRTGKILANKNLTEDVFEIMVQPTENFNFQAGQFVTFKIDDQVPPCFRAYSIASAPNTDPNFDICIKLVNKGRGSNWLQNLKPDDTVNFLGPNGKFTFTSPVDKKIIFVATGTGIAPFKAIIEDELKKGNTQTFHLIFGVRYIKDIFYQDFFEDLAKKHQNFTFDLTLSKPENGDWSGKTGRVTDLLQKLEIDETNTEVYICGLKDMINSVSEILKEKGLGEEMIHFEKYD